MTLPFVSYITFNRLGLTIKSLSSILSTPDKFEMHIIDNNSSDGTWEYLTSLNDKRIASKTRLPVNSGKFHALNLNLTKRQKDQFFISLDNTVTIWTKDWTTRILKIFNTFPELGLLSVLPAPHPQKLPPLTPRYKIRVNPDEYGLNRDQLFLKLQEYNIICRKYFFPLCSNFECYRNLSSASKSNLPVANRVADSVLTLPLHGSLNTTDIEKVCDIIRKIQQKSFNNKKN